jgi:hypothetical protein
VPRYSPTDSEAVFHEEETRVQSGMTANVYLSFQLLVFITIDEFKKTFILQLKTVFHEEEKQVQFGMAPDVFLSLQLKRLKDSLRLQLNINHFSTTNRHESPL